MAKPDLITALKQIERIDITGTHRSAEQAIATALAALDEARAIAREALAKAEGK